MEYLHDIVSALVYLESLNIIIQDLTLPNCLLFNNKTIKLSDYTKFDDRYVSRYVQQMPIRWLPGDIVTKVNQFFIYNFQILFLSSTIYIYRMKIGQFKQIFICLVLLYLNYFI